MSKYFNILKFEYFHLVNAPYKIISILLFAFSIIYGCQIGYVLFKKHDNEIKSIKSKKETLSSHYEGTKNFLDILKSLKLNTKFFKANSGYIFSPQKGFVHLNFL